MSKYFYLIAGLPDVALEDTKITYSIEEFNDEIYPYLSKKDKKIIDLFFLSYDNKNLFNLLLNEEAKINARGNFTKEKLLYFISIIKESVENDERIIIKEKDFPAYLVEFLKHYFSDQEKEKKPKVYLEDYLSVLYYKYALKCKNEFTAKWFQFNLNLKNTLIALSGRRYNIDVSESILGENQIAKALRTSTMRDFGLSEELDYLEELIKVDEITELTDREKKIDELRWRWMEEETITNYFTIERLFVFLIQIDIIERWNLLDKEKGNQIFRGIIDSLKNEVQIPKEFR
ncbi:MAG: DUF2764 family protein [Bacteroides sp.]|nr:DUF2764 domain-containing protein [Bacteroides sp.]MDD2645357.1 DUF2764 family protein [Bacteroides sp.]MDD4719963.1 DUF2764 family protein [Bacteroides sp.]